MRDFFSKNIDSIFIQKVISLIFLFVYLFHFFFVSPSGIWEFYILFMILVGCTVFLVNQEKGEARYHLSLKNFFFFCFLYFTIRYFKLGEMQLWLDEYDQFKAAYTDGGKFLYFHTLFHAQFPIEYLFSFFSTKAFALSPWSLKFPPLLHGFISLFMVFNIGRDIGISKKWNLILTSFYLSHPLIIGYNLEGRPYSLAVLTSLVFIASHLQYLRDASNKNLIRILSSNFLFILSFGITPILFISSWFPFIFLKVKDKRKYTIVNLISLASVIPSYLMTFKIVSPDFHSKTNLKFNDLLFKPDLEVFYKAYVFFSGAPVHTGLILLLFIIFLFKRNNPKDILFWLGPPFLFIILNFLAFSFIIPYPFYTRYLLLLIPSLFVLIFQLTKECSIKEGHFHTLMAIAIVLNFIRLPLPLHDSYDFFGRIYWKDVFNYINQTIKKEDELLVINFNRPKTFRIRVPIGMEFYAENNILNKARHYSTWNTKLHSPIYFKDGYDYCEAKEGAFLYILYQNSRNSEVVPIHNTSDHFHKIVFAIGSVTIAKIPIHKNLAATLKHYYEWVIKQFGTISDTHAAIEGLYLINRWFSSKEDENIYYFYRRAFQHKDLKERKLRLEKMINHRPRKTCL